MESSLILSFWPFVGSRNKALNQLKEKMESPTLSEIKDLLYEMGFEEKAAAKILYYTQREAEKTIKILMKQSIHVVDFWSIHYPRSLRFIENPPWNLFFMGNLPQPIATLAVVGSRKADEYGKELVEKFLPGLKTRPLQIVSGLAQGIDSLAHVWSCEIQVPNFAIMGCGLDQIYPIQNTKLAERILSQGGGWLSEYPPGVEPLAHHFPYRNRIISGLSDVVWVVQATTKSGSLHTAQHGLNQGKVVAVVPGNIYQELSELPNELLFSGAQPILKATDLDLLLEKERFKLPH